MNRLNGFFNHVTIVKLWLSFSIVLLSINSSYSQSGAIRTSKKAIRYNRVEGLHLGTNVKLFEMNGGKIRSIAFGGYGFSSAEFTYGTSINYKENRSTGYEGSILLSHDIATNDEHIMGWLENTATSFFAKRDYLDYFLTTGLHANLMYRSTRKHELSTYFHSLDYDSLRRKDVWSFSDIFDSDRIYRPNPGVEEGRENKFSIGYSYDSRINQFMLTDNFIFDISLEKAGGVLGGNFEYYGGSVKVKKYNRTFGPQMLVVRGFLGIRDRLVDEQFLYDLGGIGTLRGYEHKEFTGNRIGMVSFDYLFNRAIFKMLPVRFLPFYPTMSIIAFFDAGWTNLGSNRKPFPAGRSFDSSDIKTNIGLGYSIARDMLRINFAKRLDGKDGIIITLRFFQRL